MQTSSAFIASAENTAAAAALSAEWAKGMMLPAQALLQHFDLPSAAVDALQALPPDVAMPATSAAVPVHAQPAVALHETVPSAEPLDQQNRQGFRVGEIGLMIGYDEGSELTDLPALYFLPNAPAWFAGLINLHGLVIPVVDLALFLGVASASQTKRMLLVLGHGADAIGVVIEGLPQRLRWTADMQIGVDIAPNSLLAHIKAACLVEDSVWFDLNTASLLAALEDGMRSA